MVLGHKLGHFDHRDHLRKLGNVLLIRATLAYLLGDLSSLEILVADGINAQYSQRQEIAADRVGLNLLYDTYGHVAGATGFFERSQGPRTNFLSTHPAPARRIELLENLIQERNYPLQQQSPLSIDIVDRNEALLSESAGDRA